MPYIAPLDEVPASDRHSTHTSKMATKLPHIRRVSIAPTNDVDEVDEAGEADEVDEADEADDVDDVDDVDEVVSNGHSATPESTTSSWFLDDVDESIPKPNGEPGHPGRGGYNLKTSCQMEAQTFDHLKVLVFLSSMYFIIDRAFRNVCTN